VSPTYDPKMHTLHGRREVQAAHSTVVPYPSLGLCRREGVTIAFRLKTAAQRLCDHPQSRAAQMGQSADPCLCTACAQQDGVVPSRLGRKYRRDSAHHRASSRSRCAPPSIGSFPRPSTDGPSSPQKSRAEGGRNSSSFLADSLENMPPSSIYPNVRYECGA